MKKRCITLLCSIALLCASAYAQRGGGGTSDSSSWLGGTGNWSDSSKWNTGVVPDNVNNLGYDVTIASGTQNDQVNLDGFTGAIDTLTLGAGSTYTSELTDSAASASTLDVTQSLTVRSQGTINLSSSTLEIGSGDNAGQISLQGGNLTSNSFTNSGSISVYSGSNFGSTASVLLADVPLTNSGQLYIYNGGTVTFTTLSNSGTIDVALGGTLTIEDFTTLGGTLSVYGTVSNVNPYSGATVPGFAGLTTINGTLTLSNRQTNPITPSSGTLTNNGTFTVTNSSTASVSGDFSNTNLFNVDSGAAFSVSGTFTNSDDAYENGTLTANALSNTGNVYLGSTGTLNLTNGISTIAPGSLLSVGGTVNSGATVIGSSTFAGLTTIAGTLDLNNGQTNNIYPAGINNLTGTLANSGSLSIANGTTVTLFGNYTQSAGSTTVDGAFSAISLAINGGTLAGNGTVESALATFAEGSTLAPEASGPGGTLTFTGNVQFDGALDEKIFGNSNVQFSAVDIAGSLTFGADSTLQLSFFNGFTPTGDDTFTIMDVTGAIVGDFSNGEFSYDGEDWWVLVCDGPGNTVCTSGDPSVILTDVNPNPTVPTPVPEPISVALLGAGLAVISLLARRRAALNICCRCVSNVQARDTSQSFWSGVPRDNQTWCGSILPYRLHWVYSRGPKRGNECCR